MWLFCWFLGGTLPKLLYVSISNFDYMVWSSLLYIKGSISYASPYPLAGHSFPSWPHPSPAFSSYFTCFTPYIRAPQPLGHRRGARLTAGSEWLVSKRVKLHQYLQPLPTACITSWAPPPVNGGILIGAWNLLRTEYARDLGCPYENHPEAILAPCPWKNFLPWNWSLVPKRLGTAALYNLRLHMSRRQLLQAVSGQACCKGYLGKCMRK